MGPIAGIVLAGGRSQRMGRPKASLEIGGETFLERAVNTLAAGGCREVVVVLNPDEPATADLVPLSGIRSTWGERDGGAGTEQIDSLRAGLRALPGGVEAAVVLPVDHPLVEPATIERLIDAFRRSRAPIVRPSWGGRHGHPVLFAAAVFAELLAGDLPEGARTVVRRHSIDLEDVEVSDRGVLIDIDTPEDLEGHIGDLS